MKSLLSQLWKPTVVYLGLLILYSLFSYSLTDPNLVLSSHPLYWDFQQLMWRTVFDVPGRAAFLFGLIILCLYVSYAWLIITLRSLKKLSIRTVLVISALVATPMLLSYNALSHDVFNYIFNAKILSVYSQNPHTTVALDFPNDPWTRFMHNTHTAAPYGYGWTALSVVPFTAGMGIFLLTWFSFRAFMLLSIILLIVSLLLAQKGARAERFLFWLAVLLLNPIFLIEVVGNMHNDLWMLAPAIMALGLQSREPRRWWLVSAVLLVASVSIKFATVVLLPVWLLLTFQKELRTVLGKTSSKLVNRFSEHWPFLASVLLFIPLFTERSQLFHPWYLLWSLVWIPLISVRYWKMLLLLFSVSSLLRYIPWLHAGGFNGDVLQNQQLITWILPVLAVLLIVFLHRLFPKVIK